MEEKIDKYQESVGNEPINSESEHFEKKIPETKKEEVLSSPEELDSKEKPVEQTVEQIEPKKEESVKAVEQESPSEDSSSVVIKDDKAPHSKKIEEIKKLSKEEQVKALCGLVLEKDVDFATEVAKGLDDAYVLDEFHDELDKLDLIKKGKLKEL